jgi:hypothetical protein
VVAANLLDLWIVALCWGLVLVLPHFQPNPSGFSLVVDSLIITSLGAYIHRLLGSSLGKSRFLKAIITLVSVGGFAVGFIATALKHDFIYGIWGHFGAGTMKLNGHNFIFGDLAHLTAAASCSKPVITGTNVCDPWGRLFNQNSDVGKLFRFLDFTNIKLVGLFALLAFLISLFWAIRHLKIESLSPYVMLLAPVVVLAIDRGNELISVTFIMVGLYYLRSDRQFLQLIGAVALAFAVFFKLWPIFLVLSLLIFQWSRLKMATRILLLMPFLYWALKIQEIREILRVTQSGSPFGTSFGLKLISSPQLNFVQIFILVVACLGMTYLLVRLGNQDLRDFTRSVPGIKAMRWTSPLMLTYSAIWASGDSYIYRMVVLIPLVLILSAEGIFEFRWPKFTITAILVTSISSRLPLTLAVSGSLALYFIYVVFKAWRDDTLTLRR